MLTPIRAISVLLILTALLYSPALFYGYVWEDVNDFRKWSEPKSWIAETIQRPTRSLTEVSFLTARSFSGLDPFGYHLLSILWHTLNGLLVAWLALQVIGGWPAVFAVGVFLLHPVQVESVAYISGQAELVSTACLLAALVSAECRRLWLAGVCCVLAVLAKEAAIVSLLLLPLWEAWRGRLTRRGLLTLAVLAVPAVIAAFRFRIYVDLDPVWMQRIAGEWLGLLSLWLAPFPLTVEHDFPPARLLMSAGVLVVVWCVSGPARFAIAWSALSVAPRVLVPQLESLHEHHMYVWTIGLSLCAGLWLRTYAQGSEHGVRRVSALSV